MFPVERYLWLFPNDVRKLVGGAQQREGCVLCNYFTFVCVCVRERRTTVRSHPDRDD